MQLIKICGTRTLVDAFAEAANQSPERTFVRFGGLTISYGDMDRSAEGLALQLNQLGVGAGQRVAIAITNRPAFLVAFLAILRLGATMVPLNVAYKADEYRYALAHAECQALLTEEALITTLQEACRAAAHPIVCLVVGGSETDFVRAPGECVSRPSRWSPPRPSDLAGIFYTSGTTARPKGVMISHENLLYSAEVTIHALGLTAEDLPALAFPLYHVNSLFYGVVSAIALRGTVGLLRGVSISRYWDDVVEVGATWTPGITGPIMRLLLRREKCAAESQHRMRFAVGGGFTSLGEVQRFSERFRVKVLPAWSMTETVSLGTLHPVRGDVAIPAVSAIGYPTLGSEVRLLAGDGRDAEPGEPGEMLFRSPSLFQGYWKDEDATHSASSPGGWLVTGDMASRDQSGYLIFLDRKKDMIKVKGENVAAAEVERVLNQHPEVLESAVVGVPDPEGLWGERVEAYVVRPEGSAPDEQELISFVQSRLADFKVPKAVHFVDVLPKTAVGKVQRQQLKKPTVAPGKAGV